MLSETVICEIEKKNKNKNKKKKTKEKKNGSEKKQEIPFFERVRIIYLREKEMYSSKIFDCSN